MKETMKETPVATTQTRPAIRRRVLNVADQVRDDADALPEQEAAGPAPQAEATSAGAGAALESQSSWVLAQADVAAGAPVQGASSGVATESAAGAAGASASASAAAMPAWAGLSVIAGVAWYGDRQLTLASTVPAKKEASPPDATPPVFTDGASKSVSFAENGTGTVHTAGATDNVGVSSYALAGGADDGQFNLNATTGALTFKVAPDYETPGSAAGSNVYTVKVKALDAAGNSAVQTITVNVTDVDDAAPVFTSPAMTSLVDVGHGIATSTTVYTAEATDSSSVTYSLSGGADKALFDISSAGVVTFKNLETYATPHDVGLDHVYDFKVMATDAAGNTSEQAVAFTLNQLEGQTLYSDAAHTNGVGKLIAPTNNSGKTFYYWDFSGNGLADGSDAASHDFLDGIFNKDINGNANPAGAGADTTDTYRYGALHTSTG